jgi:hypothetical protein
MALAKSSVKPIIQGSVVCHGGVHDLQAPGGQAGIPCPLHQLDLAQAPQIAAVDGVEGKAFLFPLVQDARDGIRQVVEGEAGKGGMVGKDGRRDDGRLQPHGGKEGQGYGQRALADAGNILNGNDFFHLSTSLI